MHITAPAHFLWNGGCFCDGWALRRGSSFSSLFLGFMFTQSAKNPPNPFVIATAYGEPIGMATVIGYLFFVAGSCRTRGLH